MGTWFDGFDRVAASPQSVASDVNQYGAYLAKVLSFMPGITSVELESSEGSSVRIRTNEGIMQRSNIRVDASKEGVVVEFDEVYTAGSKVTASSHYRHEFVNDAGGCRHNLTIRDVAAPGFLGWLYRRFAARNIGKATLASYRRYYDSKAQ